jgi:hypothetical protein
LLCYLRDIHATRTVILFEVNPEIDKKYSKLVSDFTEASRCLEVSYIAAKGAVAGLEKKYHSGNDSVVDLRKASIESKLPSRVHSNVVPIRVNAGAADIHIFPDCIWAYSNGIFGSIRFDRLRAESARFEVEFLTTSSKRGFEA